MRVLLINPPEGKAIQSELPEWVRGVRGKFEPLGLMYIAAYLKQANQGVKVQMLDAAAENLTWKRVSSRIKSFQPEVVGISCYTDSWLQVIRLVRLIKQLIPEAHVCLGGPHVNTYPEKSVKVNGVDSVVIGEGEKSFSRLICWLREREELPPGVIIKQKGRLVSTCSAEINEDLDALPRPDRSHDHRIYSYLTRKKVAGMISSRGCPYRCSFCSTPKGYRLRTAKSVVEEMEECQQRGYAGINFVDDNFTADHRRVLSICDEIDRRRLRIPWGIRSRIDLIDHSLMVRLKKSGCVRLNVGVETGTDERLKLLNKEISIAQIREFFRSTKGTGLIIAAYFMLGCPGEISISDTKSTIDFALELNPDLAMFNVLTLYPGTALYERAVKEGILKNDPWREFSDSPSTDFSAPVWDECLTRGQLQKLCNLAYLRFYFRPAFLTRYFKKLKNSF